MNSMKIIFLIISFNLLCSIGCDTDTKKSKISEKQAGQSHPALQMLPIPGGLGVNIHFYKGNENDLTMLKEADVGIVRMDVSWSGVEKIPGEYNFNQHDQLIRDLENRDIRLLFIIDYGNPLYDDGLAPHTDEGRAAYVRFCTVLAKRYASKKIIWELWNEPNLDHFWTPRANVDDYMAWCKAVVPAIRKNDPQACIIAPAVSSFDIPFIESCFKQGLLELIDGVSVHPYRHARLGPETAADEYNILAILIEQYKPDGKAIPIVSGEWGYSTTNLSAELQGKYLVRQWLSNIANHVPISIWYDWHDDGQDPQNVEHNFGTVMWDYKPKFAYTAMKTLTNQLSNYLPIGRIGLGNLNDYLIAFQAGDQVKLAIWTTDKPHEIDMGEDLLVTTIVNYVGQPYELPVQSKLFIDDKPCYVSLSTPLPNWLEMIIHANQINQIEAAKITRSIIDDPSSDSTASAVLNAIENGLELERSAALHVLVQLADKLDNNQAEKLKLYSMVLNKEADAFDKKQALKGIARIGSMESLPIVAPFGQNPLFMSEVATYYSQLALKFVGEKDFTRAEEFLIKAASISSHRYLVDCILAKMKAAGNEITPEAQKIYARQIGFINQWWIAGPFPNAGDIAEQTVYFPEEKIDFSQVENFDTLTARWQPIELDGLYAIISFAELFGRKQLAAYAYTELNIAEEMPIKFKIGSNDGVACWLNGVKIHKNLIARPLTVDEDVVDAKLKKGINHILLKVPNKGANWEVCLRLCDQDGIPLDVSRYSVKRED